MTYVYYIIILIVIITLKWCDIAGVVKSYR